MAAAAQAAAAIGVSAASKIFEVPRSSLYRATKPRPYGPRRKPTPSPRALGSAERSGILEICHSSRFTDESPGAIVATLLDEGTYLGSERTFYRVLADAGETGERRRQLTHPAYARPELLATAPNELWSWDITDLKGPAKWTRFKLYWILDVYSRYAVGWMIAPRESAVLAERLIAATISKQQISSAQLTIHADRGSAMRSRPVALLMAELGVTKSHSRPHTSNDNPFSEAGFKTMKYRPDFPARFGSIQDARAFCRGFFEWYNTQHRHSGIAMMTPEQVHYGRSGIVLERRAKVLAEAYNAHPERFVRGMPAPAELPGAVWINPPLEPDPKEGGH